MESDFYSTQGVIDGADTLKSIEVNLIDDIKGKKVLHLQCHFGLDSFSLARRGAKVTAVDFSSVAIEKAKELNEKMELEVRFIESDVYALPEVLNEQFDLIFTTYGVLGWLPDMERWSKVIHRFLKRGGELILVEFHPVVWMFNYSFTEVEFAYTVMEAIVEELEGTYADTSAPLKNKSVGWNHGLSTIIQPLIDNGIEINNFEEHLYSPYPCFENVVELAPSQYHIKGLENKLPMVFAIKGKKKI